MKILFYIVSLFTLFSCSTKEKPSQVKVVDSAVVASPETTVEASSSKSVPAKNTSALVTKWAYQKTVDKAGRTVFKASIDSPNLLEFEFPYAGGSTATLTIRKRENTTHVYIYVSKGQFNRSFQGGTARVRFDQHPPITSSISAAENGSANIIFFDSEQALIKKIKASSKMTVDVDFAGQGQRQIEFRTAGLTWNH